MTIYKLHISYTLDETEDQAKAVKEALEILRADKVATVAMVTLNRDGDKSAANLLAPINDRHYKHGKVPLSEVKVPENKDSEHWCYTCEYII